jgi:hypothetical protein
MASLPFLKTSLPLKPFLLPGEYINISLNMSAVRKPLIEVFESIIFIRNNSTKEEEKVIIKLRSKRGNCEKHHHKNQQKSAFCIIRTARPE